MNLSRKRILKLDLDLITQKELLQELTKKESEKDLGYICFANVHMCIETYRDLQIRNAVNNSNYVLADGIPLIFALRLLYGIKQERIAGMDFMPRMLEIAEKNGEAVFFYGSTSSVLRKLIKRAVLDFPALKISGFISPPFTPITSHEIKEHIRIINSSKAKYVFIALGCPKQELWMAENHDKIDGILFGVGAAFEVYSGDKKMAPNWIRGIGMEWSFRLIQAPRKLFKRYLSTNSQFIFLILIEIIKVRIFRIKKQRKNEC